MIPVKHAKYIQPIRVGDCLVPNNVWLAPLAGASTASFRQICHDLGAGLVCTELVSARGIHFRGADASWRYLQVFPEERPAAIQLFGYDPDDFRKAIDIILTEPRLAACSMIDINMGCPVKKVVSTGAGAALMLDPRRAADIVAAARGSLAGTGKPVTVKIRSGFDDGERTAADFARHMIDAGAQMICVHARTRSQFYRGKADWSVIREVVTAAAGSVPVIGNGDVVNGPGALRMMAGTGCDGIAVGRAAMGNPWIFPTILNYLAEAEACPSAEAALEKLAPDVGSVHPDVDELTGTILDHFEALADDLGEKKAALEMRSQLMFYVRGLPNAADLRRRSSEVTDAEDVQLILDLIKAS